MRNTVAANETIKALLGLLSECVTMEANQMRILRLADRTMPLRKHKMRHMLSHISNGVAIAFDIGSIVFDVLL